MSKSFNKLFGAVLAGGASSRFGSDKATFSPAGKPWAQLGLEALEAVGAQKVWSVGGQMAKLAAVGFKAVPDDYPNEGPLGGIITALRHVKAESELDSWDGMREVMVSKEEGARQDDASLVGSSLSFVLACDLPWVSKDTLGEILVAMSPAFLVVFPVDGQQKIQYLHGLWRLSSLDLLERAFENGERSIAGGLKHFETCAISTCQVSKPHTLADMDKPPKV